jgi:hypothetical protein
MRFGAPDGRYAHLGGFRQFFRRPVQKRPRSAQLRRRQFQGVESSHLAPKLHRTE